MLCVMTRPQTQEIIMLGARIARASRPQVQMIQRRMMGGDGHHPHYVFTPPFNKVRETGGVMRTSGLYSYYPCPSSPPMPCLSPLPRSSLELLYGEVSLWVVVS